MNALKAEFAWRNFGFEHDNLTEFYVTPFQRGRRSAVYMLYRWLLAGFFIAALIAGLALEFLNGKVFIYFTNWGLMLCVLTQTIAATLVTRWYFDIGEERKIVLEENHIRCRINGLIKLYWFLYPIALHSALVITTVYWLFLYGTVDNIVRWPLLNIAKHALNSILMLLDFTIVALPMRLLHCVYTLIFGIIFCIFSLIYFLGDGEDQNGNHYIYKILDWDQPKKSLTTTVGIFALFVFYELVIYVLYRLKRYIIRNCTIAHNPHAVEIP